MKKSVIWLIFATCLIIIGCIIFGGVMTVFNWNFKILSTEKYETTSHKIEENFENISIKNDTAEVILLPSDTEECNIICYQNQKIKYSVKVEDNTLNITPVDTRKWYDYISFFSFSSPKITVNLPKPQYTSIVVNQDTGSIEIPKEFNFSNIDITTNTGHINNLASASENIKLKTSTGNIKTENISANNIDLTVSTGKITANNILADGDIKIAVSTGKTTLTDIKCTNLSSTGSTGNILLNNVIANEKFSIIRSTGDVMFEDCDAAELLVETDTGNVKGNLLSSKVFITQTDTGRINVPKTTTGGKCEITTDTGDIIISVSE